MSFNKRESMFILMQTHLITCHCEESRFIGTTRQSHKPEGGGLASDKPQGNGAASYSRSHIQSQKRDCFALLAMTVIAFLLISGMLAGLGFSEEGFKYNAKSKRDPFIPLISERGEYASDAYEASTIEDIRLEGIVWDEVKGSIAIINGEIAKEGDLMGTVKVLKINKDNVIFGVNGESIKIELNKE